MFLGKRLKSTSQTTPKNNIFWNLKVPSSLIPRINDGGLRLPAHSCQWEQPYETVTTIRKQFTSREHTIPKQFEQIIPAVNTHEKYAQYLETFS